MPRLNVTPKDIILTILYLYITGLADHSIHYFRNISVYKTQTESVDVSTNCQRNG